MDKVTTYYNVFYISEIDVVAIAESAGNNNENL
jgi:hypothetical protein